MSVTIHHRVDRDDLGLGLVSVEGIEVAPAPPPLEAELTGWIEQRAAPELSPAEDARRKASRDFLRNGSYKPAGRGKPASEFLIRAARQEAFPRINGPVDANNLVSLRHCVPISLLDLELAHTHEFEIRLGEADERYVFNQAGQELALKDLVCGCGLTSDGSVPMITPIKDSQATKLTGQSARLVGCIYYPLLAGDPDHLRQITQELLSWLRLCGEHVQGDLAIALPGQSVEL